MYLQSQQQSKTVVVLCWQQASGTLTSQTNRKSAHKTFIQLILGKKSEKFVLTTQNCPACRYWRWHFPGSTWSPFPAGRAGYLSPGLAWVLCAPCWWTEVSFSPIRDRDFTVLPSQNIFHFIFSLHCQPILLSPSLSVFLQVSEVESWSRVMPVWSQENSPVPECWDEIQAHKCQNISSRQWLVLKSSCDKDITVFYGGQKLF